MADTTGTTSTNTDGASFVDYATANSGTTDQVIRDIYQRLMNITRDDGIMLSMSTLKDMASQLPGENGSTYGRRKLGNQSNSNSPFGGTQGSRRNASRRGQDNDPFGFAGWGFNSSEFRKKSSRSAGRFLDDLTDGLEASFMKAIVGSEKPFQDAIAKSLNGFAKSLGVDVEDIGKEVGKKLGQQLGNAFKDSRIGDRLIREWTGIGQTLTKGSSSFLGKFGNFLQDEDGLSKLVNGSRAGRHHAYDDIVNPEDIEGEESINPQNIVNTVQAVQKLSNGADGAGSAIESLVSSSGAAAGGMEGAAASATELAASSAGTAGAMAGVGAEAGGAAAGVSALGGAAAGASAAFPVLTLVLIAAAIKIEKIIETFGPLIEGLSGTFSAIKSAANRVQSQNRKNTEYARERLKQDMESLISAPFDILKDAANKALSAWDNVLQTVTSTQGYTKAGLQDLWSSYATRLQKEGLDSYISSADMMENLQKVLQSGLSGNVAEEFAYLATVLNNAMPTQDFFQYADSYASLAFNAINAGHSQEEAIELANSALEDFASNILYASRELSGGFSSSLSNASKLFEDSVKIVNTAREGSIEEISGVLTSVSSIVGAIAPDLADGLVEAVVNAATGGNSNEITALRSMTSAGASNTAFLRALAKDPQKVFTELFSNLSVLQNMSADNYMEVAEALSSVFGISMDAFARVDFNYLAEAISQMNTDNESLKQNMALLVTGQTTLTADQLRMQEVNKYMIDEGLSYVLDNEVGRAIQEHMWAEQLAREVEANTFAVEVKGSLLSLVENIAEFVKELVEQIPGVKLANSVEAIKLTAEESAALTSDIQTLLVAQQVATKVGSTAPNDLHNLLTSNQNLNLIGSYLSLIDEQSQLDKLRARRDALNSFTGDIRNSLMNQLFGDDSASVGATTRGLYEDSAEAAAEAAADELEEVNESRAVKGAFSKIFNWATVSKGEVEAAYSGTSRSNEGYSAIWNTDQVITAVSQKGLQAFLDTIPKYTAKMAQKEASGGITATSIAAAQEAAEYSYLTQSELENLVANTEEKANMSFDKWVEMGMSSKYGVLNLAQALTDYGLTLTDVEGYFNRSLAQATNKTEYARQAHEVQFWENVEAYNNNYFPNHFENEFLRRDWMENWEVTYMTPIRDDLHQLLEDWEDYYIHHTAYTDATASAFESAIELADLEKDEMGDSVLALAQALTENNNWLQENQEILKDPVVHANVLLSQILLVTEAIMQQNNEVATTSSLPTSLLGLGTGQY